MCVCLYLRSEQVSARIVQEVTAEAVAVLKGEQETQRLPSGLPHTYIHKCCTMVAIVDMVHRNCIGCKGL